MSRLAIALFLTLAWATAVQSASTTITVKPRASVKASQMIKLGEIATVEGKADDVARLKLVEIARAPLPGCVRQIGPDWIKTRIACAGFDTKGVSIKAPKTVVLVSGSQTVKGVDIVETAKSFMTSQLSASDITYTLSTNSDQPDLLVPDGKLELAAEPMNRAISPGNQQVYVDVLVDGSLYSKKTVMLNVRASGCVLVASQPIRAKELLTASNTKIELRDIPSATNRFLTTAPEDGAKMANRPISAGTAITTDMISGKPTIAKGDPVLVVVQSGGVKVVSKGTASQDGAVGDSIRVNVPGSREEIQATVAQSGLVEVKI